MGRRDPMYKKLPDERLRTQDEIARIAYSALCGLEDDPTPWKDLPDEAQNQWVSIVAGLEEGCEPAPQNGRMRLAHVIIKHLLKKEV